MDAEAEETIIYFLGSWLNEAVNRCDVFLESINKASMFDEHYVLTATVMSIRFSKQFVHHAKKQLKESIESFIVETKDAVDVRDMREHSDEYFLGKGKKKDEFFKGSGNGIKCDMSSSIQNENGYMLGNVIAMEKIRQECYTLLLALRQNT